MSHSPYKESCPNCDHRFTLADLKEMAEGDGWVRSILVRFEDGSEGLVTFDDYSPRAMTPIARRTYIPAAIGSGPLEMAPPAAS